MNRIHLYFRTAPPKDQFIKGDRYVIPFIKNIARKKKISGIEKVFVNLCKGFDLLKVDYDINLSFKKIKSGEPVVVLGTGRYSLHGYDRKNPVIAGIALMTHPSEWPDLFDEYPIAKYLQHSVWVNNIYSRAFGMHRCEVWPAGIDTNKWKPDTPTKKEFDLLVYNKIMWDKAARALDLRLPILKLIQQMGLSYREITYGQYDERDYFSLLKKSKAMVFLCEHESQGFACCEALSMDVPVLAWDPGYWLDPNRFAWNDPVVPATSVPFFDERCGMTFKNYQEFEKKIGVFLKRIHLNDFKPRTYILQNLTLDKSAERMLDIISQVY